MNIAIRLVLHAVELEILLSDAFQWTEEVIFS